MRGQRAAEALQAPGHGECGGGSGGGGASVGERGVAEA